MSIWDLFRVEPTQRPPSASAETESVRRITEVLDQMQPDHARYIAAFAYILSRVARSDQEVSPEETRAMEEIVAKQGDFAKNRQSSWCRWPKCRAPCSAALKTMW